MPRSQQTPPWGNEMTQSDGVPELQEAWARVRGRLRADVGESAYRSWLKPLTLMSSKNGVVRMAVPTRFMRDWVTGNYADRIRALWCSEDRRVRTVEIVVRPAERPSPKRAWLRTLRSLRALREPLRIG